MKLQLPISAFAILSVGFTDQSDAANPFLDGDNDSKTNSGIGGGGGVGAGGQNQGLGRRREKVGSFTPGTKNADCGKDIDIKLFKDSPNQIKFRPSKKSCRSGKAFVGSSDDGHKHVTIVPVSDNSEAFSASVTDDVTGAVYSIGPDADGEMMVSERYQEDFGDELDPVDDMDPKERALLEEDIRRLNAPKAPEPHKSTVGLRGKVADQIKGLGDRFLAENPANRGLQATNTVIDVMVLWTTKAECKKSGNGDTCSRSTATEANIRSHIDLAIQETNTAYTLSGVTAELNLIEAYHTDYQEVTGNAFSQGLSDLRNGSGELSTVAANRATYGADVVALIIDDSEYCGIAYLGPSIDRMFSVTSWSCATGYYSFGHEIGHNMGCNHDRGTSNACTNSNSNYGYRDPQAGFRSILAYNCVSGQCDNNVGEGCTRVQRFSNPGIQYNGKAIGNTANNNAKRINDFKETIAGYYASSPTTNSPTVAPTPCPTAGCILDVTVTMDDYASESSWTLKNMCTDTVVWDNTKTLDNPLVNGKMYKFNNAMPMAEYTFTIDDTYGDGMCCNYGNGGYSFSYAGQMETGGQFTSTDSKTIGTCVPAPPATPEPTKSPTVPPTKNPTDSPSPGPTKAPTDQPTKAPTPSPTNPIPTKSPTPLPTKSPTVSPTTAPPTVHPTSDPTTPPTQVPTTSPSVPPTPAPTKSPTVPPTPEPTTSPTPAPTTSPSVPPTPEPTPSPTPPLICSDITEKNPCRAAAGCKWKGRQCRLN